VPGDHLGILQAPGVDRLAAHVRQMLAQLSTPHE
jgi:thioesterase domain-containing protein